MSLSQERFDKAAVEIDRRLEETTDSVERQALLTDMTALASEYKQFKEQQATPREEPVGIVDSALAGFNNAGEKVNQLAGEVSKQGGQKLQAELKKTLQSAKEGFSEISSFDVDPSTRFTMYASEALQTGVNTAVDLAQAGIEGARPLIPDVIEKGFIRGGKEALNFLQNSEVAQAGLAAANLGFQQWDQFAKSNPEDARQLEAVVDVASLLVPPAKVTPLIDSTVGVTGRALERAGKKLSTAEKTRGVNSLLEPESKMGPGGVTTEEGLFRTRTFTPTPFTQQVTDTLVSVDKINPNRSFTYNRQVALEEAKKTRGVLDNRIKAAGNPKINKENVKNELANLIDSFDELPETFALTGDSQQAAKKILNKANTLLDASDGTALGMLNVRRELDSWINRFRPSVFDSGTESAISVANKQIRDMLNSKVNAVIPDDAVKNLLTKQHHLLTAADTLTGKALKEQQSLVTRLVHNVQRVGHLPSTPLALYATALALTPVVPAVAGVGATVATAVGLNQLRKSGAIQKGLGRMLTEIDKAIKATENTQMVSQLKADRLLLIDAMRAQAEAEREKESEEQQPPLKAAGN